MVACYVAEIEHWKAEVENSEAAFADVSDGQKLERRVAILQLQEQLFLRGEMRGRLGLERQAHIGNKNFRKGGELLERLGNKLWW